MITINKTAPLARMAASITEDVKYEISNLANIASMLYEMLPDINWSGFYLIRDGKLILGPFQGKAACTEIMIGKGVCGTAAAEDKTQLVMNVHDFPGHIACDSASMSEIVVPIHKNGEIYGVLDIDSPCEGRFSEQDREELEKLVKIIEAGLNSWT